MPNGIYRYLYQIGEAECDINLCGTNSPLYRCFRAHGLNGRNCGCGKTIAGLVSRNDGICAVGRVDVPAGDVVRCTTGRPQVRTPPFGRTSSPRRR